MESSSSLRLLAGLLLGSVLLTGCWPDRQPVTALQAWSQAPAEIKFLLWPEPHTPAEFQLHTQHGERFTRQDFLGQWNFVFFGFLSCPDVCPTTLTVLSELRGALLADDAQAAGHRFIFVSVDPDNDTPENIASYLDFFDPDFIGLHGDAQALQPLLTSLSVMAIEVVNEKTSARSIDHTSSVILIDPQGRAVGALPPPHDPAQMQKRFAQLRAYLERVGSPAAADPD